jgi:uncharacterized membrane protein HdeD (DUF308 family)
MKEPTEEEKRQEVFGRKRKPKHNHWRTTIFGALGFLTGLVLGRFFGLGWTIVIALVAYIFTSTLSLRFEK